jgi:hypothetical protein
VCEARHHVQQTEAELRKMGLSLPGGIYPTAEVAGFLDKAQMIIF